MSQSAGRKIRRRQERAAAKRLTGAGADLSSLVPEPPAPAWAHWWDGRRWKRHDDRVLLWIEYLAVTGGQNETVRDVMAKITAELVDEVAAPHEPD